jgi:DNA repair exonuclease SbcCD ATPase subunit
MNLTFPILLAMAAGGGLLLFLAGVLLGRGRGPTRLAELKRQLERSPGGRPGTGSMAVASADDPKTRQETGGKDDGGEELARVRKDLEIATSELQSRDHQIDELKENINRLGGRILDVENELHAKEEELRDHLRKNPEQDIIDSMDPFVDALQNESDQLREELESAYRMVNRQELELARIRSGTLELNPDAGELQKKIGNLTDELESLRIKCSRYEEMMIQVQADSHPGDETLPFSAAPEPGPARPGPLPEL